MNTVTLTPYDGLDCPFDERYKIYSDGSHYIARRATKGISRRHPIKRPNEMDEIFEDLYKLALQSVLDGSEKTKELRTKKLSEFIHTNLEGLFSDNAILEKYVRENVERKERNLWQREKRFRRKAYLNRWNYFVTFTYSDRKHTEETFIKKLRKCLSNLHTRRGWLYMGVFERGEKNDRLHFHCLIYVPNGEMIGKITHKREYSKKEGRVKDVFPNDFFERKFGRNDFQELNIVQMKDGQSVNYLLKYLRKTDNRIVYSRGIPTEIDKHLSEDMFAAEIENDYVPKWVIFDNIIKWERDILPFNRKRTALVC